MTDLTTLLRDLSEKAGKAMAEPELQFQLYAACPPALIQALVEVVMAADVFRQRMFPDDGTEEKAVYDALRRLEAVAQQLKA